MKIERTYRADEARTITLALKGRWVGSYGLCRCPAHADDTPSLSVAQGRSGHLMLHCHAGCSFTDILAALRWQGLVDGEGRPAVVDYAAIARAEAREREAALKKEKAAQRIWDEAWPIPFTKAEAYLRSRAITTALPDSLRWHPSCPHPAGGWLPALVARIDGMAGFAVHRTYLQPDGGGKAAVVPQKAMMGKARGGAVRLVDAGPDAPLAIGEGIETAFSLGLLLPEPASVWACLSTGGMKALRLPQEAGRLIIGMDGDEPGRAAGHELAERAYGLGWQVSMTPAPVGRDWNDVLTMGTARMAALEAAKRRGEA